MKSKTKVILRSKAIYFSIFVVILDLLFQNYFRGVNFGLNNRGISFGLLSGIFDLPAGRQGFYWLIFSGAVLGFVIFKFGGFANIYLQCLLIGGLGNIIARVFFGDVWDYIHLSFFALWINLSDVIIFLSVVSFILGLDENRNFVRKR